MSARCLASLTVALLLVGGCEVRGELGPPAAAPPPPPYVQGQAPASATIEAGCSFNATQLPPGAVGTVYQVSCPAGCEGAGGLWGTDVYTGDSSICRAGIHAGAITPAGGVVTVRTQAGQPAYRGSARNGTTSGDYGAWGASYSVLTTGAPAAPAPPASGARASGPTIEAGCSYNAGQIQDAIGSTHLVSCPPGCGGNGGLWGTDEYTSDSTICKAAIHAGLLTNDGGVVAVTLDPGRPAYRGSVRNGIQSWDYGAYGKGYHLQRP